MLIKNIVKSVEFGTYNNYADLIPCEILETKAIPNTDKIKVCINYTYANRNDTIALWGEYDIEYVDWASFGLKKPEPIKILHTYEVLRYNNTVVFTGQGYGINDFCKKYELGFNDYFRIRCVD